MYFFQYDLFLLDYHIKYIKKHNALDIVDQQSRSTGMWSISYVTCVDIIAKVSLTPWSIFLSSDMPTPELRTIIITIILPTDRPEIILSTARATKNEVAFA